MKITDNLAEMYATLTAKSPEMVVDVPPTCAGASPQRLLHTYGQWCLWPWLHGRTVGTGQGRTAHEAATLIRSHWEDELPENHALYKAHDTWSVVRLDFVPSTDSFDMVAYPGDMHDPITALYHYHMGRIQ